MPDTPPSPRDSERNEDPTRSLTPASERVTESVTAGVNEPLPANATIPAQIGGYTIKRVLGEGGMGLVYEAEQHSPNRPVALKVVRAGYLSQEMLRRFAQESQVLGRLQHPGIAQVYEAGTAKDDRGHEVPFFAMEYIRGVPLTDYADAQSLGTRDRLELVAKICDAVYHAHQKGVIHRDLKPGNILVDESGQPKILDFGVARATDADIQTATLQTDIGQLIGTVPYMSPEQVSGDPGDLDTRSDVYALGVIAYELLAGRLPYSLKDRMIHEAVRVIREEEPTRLSSISRTLRGDVETIVAKALEKDKTRRYQSAESLGSDIRRYLTDEPIEARPASTWYQVQKFSRRNRGLVAGVAAAFVLLIAGLAGTSFGLVEANRQRIAAEQSAEREADQRQAAEDARVEAETARVEAEAARAEEAKRAEELQLVADFQAEQLSAIEPDAMGEQLRRSLLDAAPEDQREALGAALAEINFTNIALTTLEDNIFERTIEAIDSQFEDQPLVQAQLLDSIADVLKELGLLDRATDPQARALAIRREQLGGEHRDTLISINQMGHLLETQGKLSEAEPYYREALEGNRRVLGDEHPDTLNSISNMGVLLEAQGRLSEAEAYFRDALEGRRRVLGDEHPRTLTSINNMGFLLHAQGEPSDAEPYFREALESSRRVLGDDHLDTLNSISNMGVLLRSQGKLSEAEPYYREALEGNRRVLGDEHPRTLTSISNMGVLLEAQGRLSEAEAYYREALEGKRRVLGDEHPSTLISIHNLALLIREQGDLERAEALFEQSAAGARANLSETSPFRLVTIGALGDVRAQLGRFADAEPLLLESHEGLAATTGPTHDRTTKVVGQLIDLYTAWHDAEPDAGHDAKAEQWRARLPSGDADESGG